MEAVREFLAERIEEEVSEGTKRKTVGTIKAGVERRVHDLFENAGSDGAENVPAEATDAVLRAWKDSLSLSDDTLIDASMEDRGNAGEHQMGSRQSALAEGAVMLDADRGYWTRVKAHEEEGHGTHAASFNAPGIRFGETFATITNLVEWYAITTARQPDGDLTAAYVRHREIGDALAGHVGEARLRQALRTGDLQALQKILDEQASADAALR